MFDSRRSAAVNAYLDTLSTSAPWCVDWDAAPQTILAAVDRGLCGARNGLGKNESHRPAYSDELTSWMRIDSSLSHETIWSRQDKQQQRLQLLPFERWVR